ncbi:hypothetical protein CHGG_08061 [Chaetomium globosum CBS 148.51]|uniref:[histone H3]-trimethyl-L-lysine(9) demethylase n=1 Tax=Chaetomium globosum (strain ATCC 6205 / CBS 148.51 / DSM 1962 / NBRC 6347 / NRRL 1970) TaxID=306901 RepID=Q2GVE3_CHAGB|nr:uncharacterized protein CHGG_08061 [Chaetomium globosum CBS 148.51]EAQ86808.1 hypothetical protein CHGG_08061 [Chaetomium globosum CBS 148.51]
MSIEAIGASAPAVAMDVELPAVSPKPVALHSPPDSHNAVDADGSDSELSDLDELAGKLDDDLGDEFRNEFKNEVKNEPKEEKPQDTPQEPPKVEPESEPQPPPVEDIGEVLPDHWSGTVPVFKPTMKQFKDFKLFMEKVDKYGMKSGIIKIIAPEEWKKSLPPVDDLIKQIRVREPIKQEIMGSNGTYRQVNILHQRSYNLPQWRQLCDQSEHQPPARRGERRANSDRKAAAKSRAAAEPSTRSAATSTPPKKRGGGRVTRRSTRYAKEETEEPEDRPMTPVSPAPEKEVLKSVEAEPGIGDEDYEEEDGPPVVRRMGLSRQTKQKTQSVSARRKYMRREGSAMVDEAAFKNWDYRMDVSDFTPERCEELEKTYWKTLTYAPPLYGADLPGTLFGDSVENWNLNNLPNLLDVLGTKVPGVNTAYLYLGMWKATFAWHLEDVDLYSINYLHFGAPKQWYSISQADARRFEAAMKNIWPTDAKACDQFLRHKGFLISPSHLKQNYNITVNKCVSYPGEFVVTYPYGYHSGYNLGYNCAEAVNFALDSWLPMGKIAKKCQCAQAQDSVWVDVYEIERKLRGEETEYEETDEEDEEDDDDDQDTGLPSPPSSHTVRVKAPGRKRKRGANDKEPRVKTKKIRLRLKSHVEPPCCLCPSDIPGAEIMPTDDGRKAHRMCALYLPETYIETVDGKEIIANVAAIDKARLELKCLYCRSKKGACFQCSQKKCPRSYHATCAAAAGVFVEEEEVPVFGEDGTEYKEQAFEFSCRFHRTKRDRKADGGALENNAQLRAAAKALKKNDICQLHDRVEVEWKWLLLPDPADFRLPKASANAIPMPTCRRAQKEINAKRAVDEAPRKDDEFAPGFTWAEFHAGEPLKNPTQIKIDFTKENQVWHYLGKTSTEAKAQYTEDPSRPRHNPKGNFLDTIPKPPPPVRMPVAHQARQLVPGTYPGYPGYPTTNGVLSNAGTGKPQKPYVYKPRNPVGSTLGQYGAQFTSHTFSVNTPSPSPALQQFQPSRPSQVVSRPPQPTFHNHVFHQHPQQHPEQQRMQHHMQQQSSLQVKQYQPPASDPQRKGSSALYSPDRFAPIGGSNGFPKLPGLSWPPAHMKSGQSVQPQSRAWPSPTGAAAPMTSSALKSPSVSNPQPGGAGEQPYVSAYQKYAFFQVNHNRDSSRYRTPYGQWGGFTNGYEGNLRDFLVKAQKALSGGGSSGGSKGPIKQVPTSLLQPLRPRVDASPTNAPPYAQILPRPPAQAPQATPQHLAPGAPRVPQYQVSQYHSHGYPAQPRHDGQAFDPRQPNAGPLHPATRPQYDAPQPQHGGQPSHHVWQAVPQAPSHTSSQPAHTPIQGKPQFTKQSHSPIPLPPYVRQMATASPVALKQAAPGRTPEQGGPHMAPKDSCTTLPASTRPLSGARSTPAPAPNLQAQQNLTQEGQWAPTGSSQAGSTTAPRWTSQGAMATPSPTSQQPRNSSGWAPPPQSQPQPAPPGAAVSPAAAGTEDNSALVEKMMMNLRRASQNFGKVEQGKSLAEQPGQAQAHAES